MSSWGGFSSMSQSIGFSVSIAYSRGTYCQPAVTPAEISRAGEFSDPSQQRRPLPIYQRAVMRRGVRSFSYWGWGASKGECEIVLRRQAASVAQSELRKLSHQQRAWPRQTLRRGRVPTARERERLQPVRDNIRIMTVSLCILEMVAFG